MFVTYTMNNKEKFKRYESHPALSDLDLMKMANAIPPSTMRDVATRYLGLTGSQANGSPLEVLKRWRASAFDPSKQVCIKRSNVFNYTTFKTALERNFIFSMNT